MVIFYIKIFSFFFLYWRIFIAYKILVKFYFSFNTLKMLFLYLLDSIVFNEKSVVSFPSLSTVLQLLQNPWRLITFGLLGDGLYFVFSLENGSYCPGFCFFVCFWNIVDLMNVIFATLDFLITVWRVWICLYCLFFLLILFLAMSKIYFFNVRCYI